MNKDLIHQFANSEDCRKYMEFADYLLLIMQTGFPILNYPYCVGQMQRMITATGLGDLLNGRWSKRDIFEGTNFVLPNSGLPFADRLLIVTANYWKASDSDTVAVIPFDITNDDEIVIHFSDQKNQFNVYNSQEGYASCYYTPCTPTTNKCIYGYNPKYSETAIHCEQIFEFTFE